jgi:hypothetical protein
VINKFARTKVYIVMNVINGTPEQVVRIMYGKRSIKKIELLEGSPEVLISVEASGRLVLAEFVTIIL